MQGFERKYCDKFNEYNFKYVKGAIIGEAEIVDCILVDKQFNYELQNENMLVYGNNHVGTYAWKLNNIKKYKDLIYIKGKLGLWNYEEEI